MTDKYDEKAQAFWKWFQLAPHAECRDGACEVKLATLLRTFAEEARDEGRAAALAEVIADLMKRRDGMSDTEYRFAVSMAGYFERGDHRKGGG